MKLSGDIPQTRIAGNISPKKKRKKTLNQSKGLTRTRSRAFANNIGNPTPIGQISDNKSDPLIMCNTKQTGTQVASNAAQQISPHSKLENPTKTTLPQFTSEEITCTDVLLDTSTPKNISAEALTKQSEKEPETKMQF